MKRYLAAASAAMLSFALAGPIAAQDLGLMQLQDNARTTMAQLNMDPSKVAMIDVLTLEELTRIQGLSSGLSPSERAAQIDVVLRDADERIAEGGAVIPRGPKGDINAADLDGIDDIRHGVRAEIAELGMNSDIDVDTLTEDQLMRIHLITQSVSNEAEQKMQIEKIVTDN
ncbi:hypothetical protein [Amaricoccus sp.]|uniref:hypothetical protein n=1 Tax=Amaricoccus sp. TaxID=1872485 RepID=UPI001B57D403|nr:hypothetical protein [Amaricoccus sp.]MBP7001950.1 hypothetical protein [Amaricoccus sp.]